MQLGSLRRQLKSLFVLLIAAQAIVLTLLLYRLGHFAELHTELLRLDELRTELHALRTATLDAETGQRGFVITGQEEFLQPYRAAVLTFRARIDRLRVLVAQQPARKLRVDALAAQLLVTQADMAHLVELRRHAGFEAAQQSMVGGEQRAAMDLLRAIAREIDEEVQRQVQAHERSYRLAPSVLVSLAFFGFCGGLLVTTGLGLYVLSRLHTRTMALGKPLVAVSRDLRAAAKAAVRDATNLAQFARTDADTKAEGQATLEVITRMAKDLSTVAMEITSSVRVVAEGPEPGQEAPSAAQLDSIVVLAGRVAQSALSLELTTAEQRRLLDGLSPQQLERNVKSLEQGATRVKKISKDLVNLLHEFPGLAATSSPTTAPVDGSGFEISPT